MESRALYQEVILDHNRKPRNYGRLEHPTHPFLKQQPARRT